MFYTFWHQKQNIPLKKVFFSQFLLKIQSKKWTSLLIVARQQSQMTYAEATPPRAEQFEGSKTKHFIEKSR